MFEKIKIRTANENDVEQILEVERESFIRQIQENENVFLNRIKYFSKGFLIFEKEMANQKIVIGYLSSELWKSGISKSKENSFLDFTKTNLTIGHDIFSSHCESGKNLYISSFAIKKEFRGTGLGKKLFDMSLTYFEKTFDLESEILLVNESWIGAKKIYSSAGFEDVCIVENIFESENGCTTNGFLMRRTAKKWQTV